MSLSAEELAYLRATQADALPEQATVHDRTRTRTALAQPSYAWAARPEPVGVRFGVRPIQRLGITADVLATEGARTATVPHGTGLGIGDRLEAASGWLEVVALGSGESWETAEVVVVVPVTP